MRSISSRSTRISRSGIDTSKLTIHATDIGALPTLLLAVEKPDIARTIIVGDFAPFNRPQFMYAALQSLKAGPAMDQVRASLNSNRDEILENTFTRGLPKEGHFQVAREFKDDMSRGWTQGAMTTADAFSRYYSHFTQDQGSLRIAAGPAQDAREGGVGRERSLHQQGDGKRVRRKAAGGADRSSGHGAFPPPAEPDAGHR